MLFLAGWFIAVDNKWILKILAAEVTWTKRCAFSCVWQQSVFRLFVRHYSHAIAEYVTWWEGNTIEQTSQTKSVGIRCLAWYCECARPLLFCLHTYTRSCQATPNVNSSFWVAKSRKCIWKFPLDNTVHFVSTCVPVFKQVQHISRK